MKKQLLSTSAIALGVAMVSPASAQEWNLDWGGFASTHVGYVSVDTNNILVGSDYDGVDTYTNSEINFTPSVTLDNGLTFGFEVQMEALNSGGGADGIDESFVSITGDTLGRIEIGNENSAGYKLMGRTYPNSIGLGVNSPSVSGFIPLSTDADGNLPWNFRQAGVSSLTEVAGNNDVPRITYYTPSFNGLTLGVSYAASNASNAANNGGVDRNEAGRVTDIFDIGANYTQSFGGVDLSLSGRWGTGSREGGTTAPDFGVDADTGVIVDNGSKAISEGDPETWAIGGSLGFSNGFGITANYAENENDAPGNNGDQEGWSVGVSYDLAGPWTIAFDTYQGEFNTNATGGKAEYEAYQLGASRELGAGVNWDVYAIYAEGSTNAASSLGRTKIEGTVIGTSINLSF